MKCAVHTEVDATGFCRNCGKALCASCTRDVRGILYCEGCLADLVSKPQQQTTAGSPALAGLLGFIPGLGAVYNGEFTKAVIHVVIFASFIAILSREDEGPVKPLFGILLPAFIVYMVIDAYRTAKAKLLGQAPPDSLGNLSVDKPVGPIILIGLGFLLLLNQFNLFPIGRVMDFWPVILIVLGILLLRKRMARSS